MPRTGSSAGLAGPASTQSGIDWITFIQPRDGDDKVAHELGELLVENEISLGSKAQRFGTQGYVGWQAGRVATGGRSDSHYLRISGSLADSWSERLRSLSGRPSRLDVQTSFLLTRPHIGFGTRIFTRSNKNPSIRRGRIPRRTLSQGSDGLWLGTVGRRTSRSYVRLYDKGVEQQSHPRGVWWRYELEAKRDLGHQLWREFLTATDKTAWSYSVCVRSSLSSGLRWPFRECGGVEPMPPVPPRLPPDVERTVEWLRTFVAPSIRRILPTLGREELLRVLGIPTDTTTSDQDPAA